jgi:hypothetical protein
MNVEQMAKESGLKLDPKLEHFARLLVNQCALVAVRNDDLFTMSDILDWYEAND